MKRYVDIKTWEQIAVEMNYGWTQVHNLHGSALGAASELIPKE